MTEEARDPADANDDTPEGWASRWGIEMDAALRALEPWHDSAKKCIEAYLDDKPREAGIEKLGLFTADVNTKEAMLYGNVPKVDAERRHRDASDQDGRVAAMILDRMLNGDLERDEEAYPRALANSLNDWLRVGFGNYRMRYVRETEPTPEVPAITDPGGAVLAEAVPAGEKLKREDVETDYFFWRDQAWSPDRHFGEVRWWAFLNKLSPKSAKKKFGIELPLASSGESNSDGKEKTPWSRVHVWEIWDKENACLWFWVKGYPKVIVPVDAKSEAAENGSIPDPLGITGFWPFPEPLMSNLTTSKYLPRADYALSQDQYGSINELTTRIGLLRDAVKAAGVYDKTVAEFADLLTGSENKLVAAANYAAISEKGGIAACIAWLPLKDIVDALDKLRELRSEEMALHFQVSGMSDIMRGQATDQGATATEQAIKAKYAGVRTENAQKRFARFAGEGQRIRAEIICKHFDPQTILTRANVKGLAKEDQPHIPNAMTILKSQFSAFRIAVKPDSISLTDYAANKQESMDILGTIGGFMQSIAPLAMQAPVIAPQLLELLQVFLAKVKGGEAVEGILDQAIEAAEQAAQQAAMQPKPPDPVQQAKIQTEQIKGQTEQVKAGAEQFKAKAGVVQTMLDMHKGAAEHSQSMQQLEAQERADGMKELEAT